MIEIVRNGKVVSRSKNLRGILDYARKSAPQWIIKSKSVKDGGNLRILYNDGAVAHASFASYFIMLDWIEARRCLQYVRIITTEPTV